MKVFRITSRKYSNDISGSGAAIKGGRWNKKGSRALYTSMYASLSCLEIAVHLVPNIKTPSFDLLYLDVPDDSILEVSENDLPKDWHTPDGVAICSSLGQQWLDDNTYLALKVPSSIITIEYNVILNPLHKLYDRIKVDYTETFNFDQRLLK